MEFELIDYEDRYKGALKEISLPWLEENDLLEPADLEQLEHPERVLEGGGRILLARAEGEIVGMMMLERFENGVAEPFKFGVRPPGGTRASEKPSWPPLSTRPERWGHIPWCSLPTTA